MNKSETGIILVSDGPIPIELIHAAQTLCDILLQNLPFLITIAVVVAAATVTYKSNRKSVDSQNRLAQQQRQVSIRDLIRLLGNSKQFQL